MAKPTKQNEYDLALEECIAAQARWAILQAHILRGHLDRDLVEALLATAPRGLYRHFKGGLYVVESVVYDVNGIFLPSVDYTALYGKLAGVPAGRLLYGKDALLTPVDRAEWTGRRFIRIKKLSIMESAKLRSNAKHISRGPTPEAILERALRTIDPRRAK